jgi:hypothetical protein
MLTKKHFESIAGVIDDARPAEGMPREWAAGCDSARQFITQRLADGFERENPRFDRARFLRACGVQS